MSGGGAVQPRSSWSRLIRSPFQFIPSKQSQCWRPKTLQPLILGAIACLMLTMLAILEALRQYNKLNGGLVFFTSIDEITRAQHFAYTYVPTIVTALLIQVWSVVDFDVLRLEPYYQLSKPGGVPANVLFLNYNFGQKTLAPVRAAKNRHWVVFWVSLLTFAIRMGLPPLQTMVFGLRYVPDLEYQELETWPLLIDMKSQAEYIEYISVQGNGMAAFTSDSRLPISASPNFGVPWVPVPYKRKGDAMPWKLNHTVFWAENSCQNVPVEEDITAAVTIHNLTGRAQSVQLGIHGIDLLNRTSRHRKGAVSKCTLDVLYDSIIGSDTEYFQTRLWETSYAAGRTFNTSSGCNTPDLFALLLSAKMSDHRISSVQHFASASIFACDISYHTGEASILLYPHNNSLIVDHVYREKSHVLTEAEFNTKSFQTLLSQLSTYLSDTLHLQKNGSRKRTEPYAAGNFEPQMSPPLLQNAMSLVSSDELEYKITRAINSTFLLSIEQLFDEWSDPVYVTASRPSENIALTVVDFAAFGSELVLGAAAVAALYLLLLYRQRDSFLRCDPNSIGAMCSITADMIHPNNILADRKAPFHRFSTRQMHNTFKDARCHWRIDGGISRLDLVPKGAGWQVEKSDLVRQDPRPHFLVLHLVLVEVLAILTVIVFLGLGIKFSHQHGRLLHEMGSHSTSHSRWLHTVIRVIPAVIASSMNSLCTSILRHVSLLEPWLLLESGTPSSTLSMNYAPQSPFSTLYKAVRDRRFILSITSLAASVTIVLMVLAAGVFHQSPITKQAPTLEVFQPFSQNTFYQADVVEESFHFDLVRTSIAGGTSRLPWTTENQTFIPLHVQGSPKPEDLYEAMTLGIETNLKCHHITTNTSMFWNEDETQFYWQYRIPGNSIAQCTVKVPWGVDINGSDTEEALYFLPPFDNDHSGKCETGIFVMSEREDPDNDYPILALTQDFIGLHCEPSFTMQNFDVTFNHKGDIQDPSPTSKSVINEAILRDNTSISISHFSKLITGAYFGPAADVPFPEWEDHRYGEFDEWAGYIADDVYLELYPDWVPLNPHRLSNLAGALYQEAFNSYFSASHDMYLQPHNHPFLSVEHASVIRSGWGTIFSVPVLFIAMVLISFDISVIVAVFFARQRRFKGPRVPKSIGATIPWIIHSRILHEFRNTHHLSTSERKSYLASLNERYAFGRFKGCDGQERFALDEDSISKDQSVMMS